MSDWILKSQADQVSRSHPFESLGANQSEGDQTVGHLELDSDRSERLGGFRLSLVKTNFLDLNLADIELPPEQARSKPGIDPLTANRHGKIILDYLKIHSSFVTIKVHVLRDGRLEGLTQLLDRILIPPDDINFFPVHFANNAFDPGSTRSYAGTHGIDLGVGTLHANFGTIAWLTSHCSQGNRAIGNFGNFHFKKLPHEVQAGTTQDKLGSPSMLLKFVKQATNALARNPIFPGYPLAPRKQGFGLPYLDDQVSPLLAANDSGHQVSDLITEFVVNVFLLKLSKPLLDRLLGGLRGNPPQVRRIHRTLNNVTHLRFLRIQARLVQMNFPRSVAN